MNKNGRTLATLEKDDCFTVDDGVVLHIYRVLNDPVICDSKVNLKCMLFPTRQITVLEDTLRGSLDISLIKKS